MREQIKDEVDEKFNNNFYVCEFLCRSTIVYRTYF